MLKFLSKYFKRTNWYPLSELGTGPITFRIPRTPGAVTCPEQALALSPVYAALRLYQTTIGSLPLVVYKKTADGGRERAPNNPAYSLLHERPNPAQSRAVFWEYLVKEIFLNGNAYVVIRWKANGQPLALYPVPASNVEQVYIDSEWNKAYRIRTAEGTEIFDDEDVIHLFAFSDDGIQGVPLLKHAAQSLGVHHQILESANAYYSNAAKPSGYISFKEKLSKEAVQNLKDNFKESYQGSANTGAIPVLENGGMFVPLSQMNAENSQLVQAMGTLPVADVARWFNLSPIQLGDFSAAHYNSLAADNTFFYQKSIRPLLDKFELELNAKLFGSDANTYAEFLLDGILKADPAMQKDILNGYIATGVILRSEARAMLNLPMIPGLDQPLQPLNMGAPPVPESNGATQPTAPQTV